MFALAHQPVKQAAELREPQDGLNPGNPARFVLGQFVSFPNRQVLARLSQKKHLAMFLVVRVGKEKQNRFLLLDAAEIKQIGILPQRQRAVGVGGEDVVGVDDRERVFQHQLFQPLAVGDEELRIDRRVSHPAMKVSRRKMASYFARAAGSGPRAAATALCRAAHLDTAPRSAGLRPGRYSRAPRKTPKRVAERKLVLQATLTEDGPAIWNLWCQKPQQRHGPNPFRAS